MQIEFWVEVYFETRRFRPLSSSPLPYIVFAPTLFNPCKSSSPLDWIKSRLVDLCATQIAVKFRTAPHYCKTNLFSLWKHIVFSLFSLSKNWMHNVVWGCAEIFTQIAQERAESQVNEDNFEFQQLSGICVESGLA